MKRHIIILAAVAMAISCAKESSRDDFVRLVFRTGVESGSDRTKSAPLEGTDFPYRPNSYNTTYPHKCDYYCGLWICNGGTFTRHMTGYENFRLAVEAYDDGTPVARKADFDIIRRNCPVDIYGYHPQVTTTAATTIHSIPVSAGQIDWMYADKVELTSEDTDGHLSLLPVNINFRHAMACICIRMRSLFSTTVDVTSLTLTHHGGTFVTVAEMDITTGALTPTKTASSITIAANNVSNRLSSSTQLPYSFFFPTLEGVSAGDLEISFKFDSISGRRTFVLPLDFGDGDIDTFEAGKLYIYELTLDNTLLITPVRVYQGDWQSGQINLDL